MIVAVRWRYHVLWFVWMESCTYQTIDLTKGECHASSRSWRVFSDTTTATKVCGDDFSLLNKPHIIELSPKELGEAIGAVTKPPKEKEETP